jgi:hypothetical protein
VAATTRARSGSTTTITTSRSAFSPRSDLVQTLGELPSPRVSRLTHRLPRFQERQAVVVFKRLDEVLTGTTDRKRLLAAVESQQVT